MLTERQLFLLHVLVDDYVRSAEPVGSRTIAKRGDVSYSPATIRNELADLEEMGFLEKTHSSSGRIPSEKGYRFYVDHILSPELLSAYELSNIQHVFTSKFQDLENLIQTTAKVLSDFSQYTAIVLGPEQIDSRLKHLQLLHLGKGKAVMIIVTDTGHVEHRVIHLPRDINNVEIERLVNILNEKLKAVPLYQLHTRLQSEVQSVLKEHVHNYEQVIRVLQDTMKVDVPDQIFYGGKNNILSQPEFRNIDKVLPLLDVLEQKELVHQWLRSPASGLQIKIGGENDLLAVKDCSLITTTYSIGGEHLGTVALLGPTRMAYPRVVSLMETVSKSLSDILKKRYL